MGMVRKYKDKLKDHVLFAAFDVDEGDFWAAVIDMKRKMIRYIAAHVHILRNNPKQFRMQLWVLIERWIKEDHLVLKVFNCIHCINCF